MNTKSIRELRRLGRGIFHGTTLTSFTVPRNLIEIVFFPVTMMTEEQIDEVRRDGAVEFYGEWKDGIGPRGINGYPVLGKMGFLNKREVRILKRWWLIEMYFTTLVEEGIRGVYTKLIKPDLQYRWRRHMQNVVENNLEKRMVSWYGWTKQQFHEALQEGRIAIWPPNF